MGKTYLNKLENLIQVDCKAMCVRPCLELKKMQVFREGWDDWTDRLGKERKRRWWSISRHGYDGNGSLNNIILELNHGDFAEKFILFQKTNLGSTYAIWMLLILVFQSCLHSSGLPFYFYLHFRFKTWGMFF